MSYGILFFVVLILTGNARFTNMFKTVFHLTALTKAINGLNLIAFTTSLSHFLFQTTLLVALLDAPDTQSHHLVLPAFLKRSAHPI